MAVLELNADPSGMVRGANKAREALGKIDGQARKTETAIERMSARSSRSIGRVVKSVAKMAAGFLAVAASGAMVKSSLRIIDAQAKLAHSFNTTTKSMQVLTRAADLAGVSQGEVEQATIMMTKALSQAATGTGPAVKSLKAIHLTAQGLSKLTIDKKMIAIQDAIQKFVPPAQRAAVALGIFGARAGLVFTRIDSATLRQATRDVTDYGVAVSQVDSAAVEKTNDAISRMGLIWRGLANQVTVALVPTIKAFADTMNALSRRTGALGIAFHTIIANLGQIAIVAGSLATLMAGRFALAMGAAALGIMRVNGALVISRGALIRTGFGAVAVAVGELVAHFNLLGGSIKTASDAQLDFNRSTRTFTGSVGPAARAEVIASAKAYIAETHAKLLSAQATLDSMRLKQQAGQALLDKNPLSRDDKTAGSASAAMATNVERAQVYVLQLQGALTRAVTQIGKLKTTDIKTPMTGAATAAGDMSGALGGAVGKAASLAGYAKMIADNLHAGAQKIADLKLQIKFHGDPVGLAVAQAKLANPDVSEFLGAAGGAAAATRARAISQAQTAAQLQIKLSQIGTSVGGGGGGNPGLSDAQQLYQSTRTAAEKYAAAVAHINDLHKRFANIVTNDVRDRALKNLRQTFDATKNSVMDLGTQIKQSLGSAFVSLVTGAKSLRQVISDVLRSLATMVANAAFNSLWKNIGGGGLLGNIFGALFHDGGLVGAGGPGRMVPAMAFAGAPRMHGGGFAGLQPGEVPAILQRGERVLSRREVANGGATRIEVVLSPDLQARVLQQAQAQSVAITQSGLEHYDAWQAPQTINRVISDPRARG